MSLSSDNPEDKVTLSFNYEELNLLDRALAVVEYNMSKHWEGEDQELVTDLRYRLGVASSKFE